MNKGKGKDLQSLYSSFDREMEKVDLPSQEELLKLLQNHDGGAGGTTPIVPLARKRIKWQYAAAAIVVFVVSIVVTNHFRGHSDAGQSANLPQYPQDDISKSPVADVDTIVLAPAQMSDANDDRQMAKVTVAEPKVEENRDDDPPATINPLPSVNTSDRLAANESKEVDTLPDNGNKVDNWPAYPRKSPTASPLVEDENMRALNKKTSNSNDKLNRNPRK